MPSSRFFQFLLFLLLLSSWLGAQDIPRASIRGLVFDKDTRLALDSFRVEVLNISPPKSVQSKNNSGFFVLDELPLGRYRLLVEAPGYYEQIVPNILVQAVQNLPIEVALEALPPQRGDAAEATVLRPRKSPRVQNEALNVMSRMGILRMNVEEVNRFSGSRSDVARLATGSAGMINSDDARNDLIVRGASPLGIAWRIEGLPIINPNHLGYMSTTAGYFPLLNINLMDNSDFLMGNFSNEYGNSTSGIFDLNLRAGNTTEHNFLAQFGFNGLEALAEGPISFLGLELSYAVAARYSVLEYLTLIPAIQEQIGVAPQFGDLNFHIHSGTASQDEWSIFGLFGAARAYFPRESLSEDNVAVSEPNKDLLASNQNGFLGMTYRRRLSPKSYWRTALGSNRAYERNYADYYLELGPDDELKYRGIDYEILNWNQSLHSYINIKQNASLTWRAGLELESQFFRLFEDYDRYNEYSDSAQRRRHDAQGHNLLARIFGQLTYRLGPSLELQTGLSIMAQSFNSDWAPNASAVFTWQPRPRHRLALGYAWQHQQLPQRIYFFRTAQLDSTGRFLSMHNPHESLEFIDNHYLNIEYLLQLSEFWQIKLSPYYQLWSKLPVDANRLSGYSLFNSYSNLPDNMPRYDLASRGRARNMGIDLSVHRSFKQGFYLLATASYFNSQYQGSDTLWRNSLFNREYIFRARAGKEFAVGKLKSNTFFLSATYTLAGGEWVRPIDLEGSRQVQLSVFEENAWHSERSPAYMRLDLKLGMRINSKKRKISHYWYLDILNLTNHQNVLRYQYVRGQDAIAPIYQVGLVPDILYRIQF